MLNSEKVFTLVGRKFYRYLDENDESSLEVVRVIGVQNVESVKIKKEDGSVEKVNPEYIIENYRAIKSDGVMGFAIVSINDGCGNLVNDIIVCLYKQSDLDEHNTMPYVVCRQNVNDIFYEYMNPNPEVLYAGCSVSVDSIPSHLNMDSMLQCESVDKYYTVQVYLDDSLDEILSMVKTSKYDEVFKNIQAAYIRAYEQIHGAGRIKKGLPSYHGYCNSLKTLLEENNFMYDFNSCFGIVSLNFKVEIIDDNGTWRLKGELIHQLMDILKKNIKTTYVIPYDKTVDLSNIKMGYIIAKDINNDMYVIGYLEEGEYVIVNVDEKNIQEQMRLAAASGLNVSKYSN